MPEDLTPLPVPPDSGEICSRQMCFKSGRWRIQKKIYCEEHTVLAEWLPGVPKSWTGPRGKKNQLKLPFPEATDGKEQASGEDRTQRQGKEDAGGVSEERGADCPGGVGENRLPVDGGEVDDARQFLDQKLAPLSDSDQAGEAGCAGAVPEVPDRDREEGDEAAPWDEEFDDGPKCVGCEEYDEICGGRCLEEDPDFKRDARANGDFR